MKNYIGDIPNTHIRDFQRKKLYQAEEDCLYPTSKSLPYICHEMSHVINYNDPDKADHHGANFAGTYLQVVKEFIGEEDYQELLNAFKHRKVKYNV